MPKAKSSARRERQPDAIGDRREQQEQERHRQRRELLGDRSGDEHGMVHRHDAGPGRSLQPDERQDEQRGADRIAVVRPAVEEEQAVELWIDVRDELAQLEVVIVEDAHARRDEQQRVAPVVALRHGAGSIDEPDADEERERDRTTTTTHGRCTPAM